LDDSTWQLLRSDRPWDQQGYQEYGGLAWYRFKIELPADRHTYALYLSQFGTSYQVFADGRLLGTYGGMPPKPRTYMLARLVIPLPPAKPNTPMTIAIRTWRPVHGPSADFLGGGPGEAPRVGELDVIRTWAFFQDKVVFWFFASNFFIGAGWLIAGIAGLALFALRRSEREYLWFGLYGVASAGFIGFHYLEAGGFATVSIEAVETIWMGFETAASLAFLLFVWRLIAIRRDRLFYCALSSIVAVTLIEQGGELILNLVTGTVPSRAIAYWGTAVILPQFPYWVSILIRLFKAAR
jgi:hypothetical protein